MSFTAKDAKPAKVEPHRFGIELRALCVLLGKYLP